MTSVADTNEFARKPVVYLSVNRAVLSEIPLAARNLLDVGCGGGVFGAALKSERVCTVVGLTYSETEADMARVHLDRVEVVDLNTLDPAPLGRFDCVVCSHVLEHLNDPRRLLRQLRNCLAPQGMLIVALPNALHWKQRLQFLSGRFRYTDGGLMDRTHFRFFDWVTAAELMRESGYQINSRHADGVLPLARLLGPKLASHMNRAATSLAPGLLGSQFVLCCQPDETSTCVALAPARFGG